MEKKIFFQKQWKKKFSIEKSVHRAIGTRRFFPLMHKSRPSECISQTSWHAGTRALWMEILLPDLLLKNCALWTPLPTALWLWNLVKVVFEWSQAHWILKCLHHFQEASSWTPWGYMTSWIAVALFTHHGLHMWNPMKMQFCNMWIHGLGMLKSIQKSHARPVFTVFCWKPRHFDDKGFLLMVFF